MWGPNRVWPESGLVLRSLGHGATASSWTWAGSQESRSRFHCPGLGPGWLIIPTPYSYSYSGSGLGLSRCLGPGECLHSFIPTPTPTAHTRQSATLYWPTQPLRQPHFWILHPACSLRGGTWLNLEWGSSSPVHHRTVVLNHLDRTAIVIYRFY